MDHRIEGAGRAGGDDLCRVWADLAADPDNAAVAAAARAQLTALVFHVPFCDACASVSDSMPFSQKVFDVLGNIDHLGLSDEELQELRAIDDAMGDDDDLDDESMAAAVECLLAGLPEHVSAEVVPLGLVTMFRAIEAIDRLGETPLERNNEAAIEAILRHAGVSREEAESLWDWQRIAAGYCPTLYQWQVQRPRAREQPSTMPTILSYLRTEERKNPGAVTDAPADTSEGEEAGVKGPAIEDFGKA